MTELKKYVPFKPMRSEATAHSKLLLFGEHAAVYGLPAVGLPLPSTLTVSIAPSATATEWRLEKIDSRFMPAICNIIREIGRLVPEFNELTGGTIGIDSGIIPSVGLGSSAALCVAFIKAVCGLFPNVRPGFEQIWYWANACEGIFHGSPSGIDTGISFLNRLCAFYPTGKGLPRVEIITDIRLYFLIGVFRRNATTGELVARIKRKIQQDKSSERQIRKLGSIAQSAIEHLKENKTGLYDTISLLATKAQTHLTNLGLNTPEQDHFIELGLKAGAPGGKLSGAGGGGAFYLIARNKNQLMTLSTTLRKASSDISPEDKPNIQQIIWENEKSRFVS
jgi:mevalonate kinase